MSLRLAAINRGNQKLRTTVVYYTWHCFNCHRIFRIPKRTFFRLQAGVLKGVQCRTCLTPPKGVAVAAA